jgi:hypothetical protein
VTRRPFPLWSRSAATSVHDPKCKPEYEALLRLAAGREILSKLPSGCRGGIDPDCQSKAGRTLFEQQMLARVRRKHLDWTKEFITDYIQVRLEAARRVFNEPDEVERIIDLLEAAMSGRARRPGG